MSSSNEEETIYIEEVPPSTTFDKKDTDNDIIPLSEEKMLDALAIEEAAKTITDRPTAKLQLDNLVQKLKRESQTLKRVEISKKKAEAGTVCVLPESAVTLPPNKSIVKAPTKDVTEYHSEGGEDDEVEEEVVVSVTTPITTKEKYVNIDRFAFDAGGYDSKFVSLYINLDGVGSLDKDLISCDFTAGSFDLVVKNYQGNKNMRLFKDNLDKDIDPEKSKFIVKKDKIVLKLHKVKGEFGSFDYWTDLTSKKGSKEKKKLGSGNPTDSIMDLMKDMYNSGDDNMKKMIGETMMKQQRGELGRGGPDDNMMGDLPKF